MPSERLCKLCREGVSLIGLDFSEQQFRQLLQYLDEITLWNPTYRLVGADGEELVIKHLLDSLAAVPVLKQVIQQKGWSTCRFCDVGSGAGLPGIPLAIAFEGFPFTLIERMGRRVGFLRNALAVTGLSDRVEVLPLDLFEVQQQFDIVTFRAFHPLEDVIKGIGAIVAEGGVVCAYKSQPEHVQAELDAVQVLVDRGEGGSAAGWSAENIAIDVPFLDASRLVCLLSKNT